MYTEADCPFFFTIEGTTWCKHKAQLKTDFDFCLSLISTAIHITLHYPHHLKALLIFLITGSIFLFILLPLHPLLYLPGVRPAAVYLQWWRAETRRWFDRWVFSESCHHWRRRDREGSSYQYIVYISLLVLKKSMRN